MKLARQKIPYVLENVLIIISNTTGLSFELKRIGLFAAIIVALFYLLVIYLLFISKLQKHFSFSACSKSLLKSICQHLLLLVGIDTPTYRKDYDRSPTSVLLVQPVGLCPGGTAETPTGLPGSQLGAGAGRRQQRRADGKKKKLSDGAIACVFSLLLLLLGLLFFLCCRKKSGVGRSTEAVEKGRDLGLLDATEAVPAAAAVDTKCGGSVAGSAATSALRVNASKTVSFCRNPVKFAENHEQGII